MKINKSSSSFMLIAFALCFPIAAQAEMSFHDTWSTSGKLVIEGAGWNAVFGKEEGALTVYSDTKETMKIAPFYSERAQTIISCEVIEDKEKQLGIRVFFSADQEQIEGLFIFDQEGVIQIEPLQNMKGILISGEISFGVVPSPPLDDLIYDPEMYPSAFYINLPSENLFLGLLKGEDRLFFCAWPYGDQKVKLLLGDGEKEKSVPARVIKAFEIQLDGKNVYLKSVSAPGIWHREELRSNYLEKDIDIKWKKPFQARWKTQLLEGDIETSFPFATEKERIWRPNFGFYEYPAWFKDESGVQKACFSFSKKIPPSRQAIIYALEGHRDTPLEFARTRLQHEGTISTLKPKTGLRRYPLDNVGIQNCDGRAWVKWIFKVDYQTREEEFLQEVMSDFLYSINVDKGRLAEYEIFIPKIKGKIDLWIEKNPEFEPFLSQMKARVETLEREYWDRMDNSPASKHLQEETEAINKLKTLIEEEGLEVYPEVCYLLDKIQLWSDIESVPGRVGGLLRQMFQQAGYDCANNSAIVKYAEEIRRDIREFIINGETHETVY